MNPDAIGVQDVQQVAACLAALAGLGGILCVAMGLNGRLTAASAVLLTAFALLLGAGALGIPGTFASDAQWSWRLLAAGVVALVVGVMLSTFEGRSRSRAHKLAVSESESLRREVDRLSGTNVRLEDEIQQVRSRASSADKQGGESELSRTAREAGAIRQRKAVEVAQASERKHRSIFEGALEGMAMLERETLRLVTVNPSLARMTGHDAEELGKLTLVDLFVTGANLPGKNDLQRSAREGRPICVEIQRKDGGATWADVSISVIGTGAEAQLLTVVRDVSERRLLEQELQLHLNALKERERRLEDANRELAARTSHIEEMNLRLQELQAQKDHFVSTVSHELRTPLTSIRSFSEILLKHADTEPEIRREFVTIINKESERLTRLVNNVLDLARIEAGEARLEISEFDVRDVVADAAASMAGMAADRRVAIRCETGDVSRPLCGDRDKVQQIVMNLLSNAVKYSKGDDEVEVRVYGADTPGRTELCVSDLGPGILPSELERVFEKFRRNDEAVADGTPGTGLGLAICREIATLHGGRIWAESDGARGSRFRVELPGLEESRRLLGPGRPAGKAVPPGTGRGPRPRVGVPGTGRGPLLSPPSRRSRPAPHPSSNP